MTGKHRRSKPNHKPVLFGLGGGETQGYRHRHRRFMTKGPASAYTGRRAEWPRVQHGKIKLDWIHLTPSLCMQKRFKVLKKLWVAWHNTGRHDTTPHHRLHALHFLREWGTKQQNGFTQVTHPPWHGSPDCEGLREARQCHHLYCGATGAANKGPGCRRGLSSTPRRRAYRMAWVHQHHRVFTRLPRNTDLRRQRQRGEKPPLQTVLKTHHANTHVPN